MNNFLKANPLILSFLIIIGWGLGSSVSAQIVATDVSTCAGQSATVSAVATVGSIQWHSQSSPIGVIPSAASLLGVGPSYNTPALAQTTTYFAYEIIGGLVGFVDNAVVTVNEVPAPPQGLAEVTFCDDLFVPDAFVVNSVNVGDLINFIAVLEPDDTVQTASFNIFDETIDFSWGGMMPPGFTSGEYTFYISVEDAVTGCESDPLIMSVTILDPPAAPTVSGNTAICSGGSTLLTAAGSGGDMTWYSDAGLTTVVSTGSQYTTPALGAGTTSYWVTETFDEIIAANCESAPTQVDINVSLTPADPIATGDEICAGETASLEATGSGGTLNWYGDAAGITLVGSGSPFVTPALVSTTIYYVQEDDGTCLSGLVPVTATVNQLPTAPEVEDYLVACESESTVTISFVVYDEQIGYLFNITAIEAFTGDTVVDLTGLGPITEIGTQVVAMGPIQLFPFGDHYIITTMTHPVTGCTSIPDISILNVAEGPVAPLVLATVEICEGETATLFAFGDFDSTSFVTWYDEPSFDPIAFGWEYETQPLFFDQTFYASVTNEAGCEGPLAAVTVIVNSGPDDLTGTDATVCEGEMAMLGVEGAGGTYTWYSDGAATNPLATGSTFFTPILAQTTVFYVQETDLNGCKSGVVGVTAFVTQAPNAPQGVGITLCIDEAGQISATGSGSGSLIWYNSNLIQLEVDAMPPATGTLAVGPFNDAGTYFFYVSESDGDCESALTEIQVTVGGTPEPLTVEDATVCAGESATLTAVGTGGDISWYSDFALTNLVGIGPSFETGPLFTTTSFWVTESFGSCESTPTEVEVTVNELPGLAPISSNAPICEGGTLMLMTDFVPGGTYAWSGPGGFFSSQQNPVINDVTQATNQGMYTLVVTDAGTGCSSSTSMEFIQIYPTPDAPSITSNSPICAGETVILISSEVQGATSYNWYDGEENLLGSTAGTSFTIEGVLVSSLFGVSVTVNGCESPIATTWVVVSPLPEPVQVTTASPICEGVDIVLSATIVPGATYAWSGPNGPIDVTGSTVTIPDATLDDAGTYSVFIILNGCPSEVTEVEVVVNAAPVLPQNPTSNSPVCEHDTLYLIGPFLEGVTYQWTGPDGFFSTEQSPVIYDVSEADNQGFYTLVVTDIETGCTNVRNYSLLVLVNSFPDNVLADNSGPVCEGDDLTLTVTSIFNAVYVWTGPLNYDVTTTEPFVVIENVQPSQAGTYTVTILLGDCASMQVSTEVLIYANPIADAGDDLWIEEGTIFQLDGTESINAVDYFWQVSHPRIQVSDIFDNTTSPNPIIGLNGPLEASEEPYLFVLTVWNEFGCTDKDTVLVYIYATQNLVIPNIITPNGDGINDTWVLTYLDNLENYDLSIYARGGTLILRTDSYNNDWNGTMGGDDLPEGTYWYTIHHDGDNVYKGFIEVVR